MGKKVLVDSDILLKAYRGNEIKHKQLLLIKDRFFISVVTALELINGANNIKQLASIRKELKAYPVIHLNENISALTLQLYSKYSICHPLRVADLFIASTAIFYGYELYTDNKKTIVL